MPPFFKTTPEGKFMLYAIIAVAIVVLDQYFKYWIVQTIDLGGSLPFIPRLVGLTYVRNTGGAFSILSSATWLLTVITAIFIVGLIIYLIKGKLGKVSSICVAAVIGGAICNLIDRIRLGYVVDMFETLFMKYAIFNIADCFIVVGVILFCIFYLIEERKKELEAKAAVIKDDEGKTDDENS